MDILLASWKHPSDSREKSNVHQNLDFWSHAKNCPPAKIDSETLGSLLKPENVKALTNILTYHVVSGKLMASDVVSALKSGNGTVELTALNSQTITAVSKDGKIYLKDTQGNMSQIIATDVAGSNGVIHVIDSVVMPE